MPESREPIRLPDVNPETEPFVLSPEQLKDALALQVVKQTFSSYESWRTANHDARWNDADSLYTGYVPARAWEGTTIPRANLPYQISFDQVESAFPSIMQALFGDEEWFEVVAEPGTPADEAKQVQAAMKYMLDHAKNDYGLTAISEMGLAIHDLLQYGTGGLWIDWDSKRNRPITSWVDIRDLYIDPACPTPNIDESRATIRRRLMTVQDIEDLRPDSRMKVPDESVLWYMAQNAPIASADNTRQSQEALRRIQYTPQQANWIPNPAQRKIEVLMYYTKTQIIWVLNREHILYNQPNPYGFVPIVMAPCYIFTGRFYANGIPDVQMGNQRMIEGMLNGHLDEISLGLHPPRVQGRGDNQTNNQRKWGPGFVFNSSSEDVKNSTSLLQPDPVTQNIMSDVGFLLDAADKRTGIGAVAQGTTKPGNANRTATGMNLQATGAANRLQPIVRNIEDYMLVPLLRKMYKMLSFHLGLYDKVPAKKDGVVEWVDGFKFQRPCDFEMLASSKMMAKSNLLQMFPFITQYLLSGPLLESLKASGQTVDFSVLIDMLQDAAGTKGRYDLIRPMNQQEQQAAQQPPPEVQAQMQERQGQNQHEKEIMQMKIQGDIQKTAISKQGSPEEMQMKFAESQQKMQLEQFKAQMDAQMQQQKLEFEKQMATLKLQVEQKKGEAAVQTAQTKMAIDQQMGQQKLQMQEQQSAMDFQTALLGNQQQLRHNEESHKAGLQQQKEQGVLKVQQTKQMAAAKPKPRQKAEVRKKKPE